MAQQGTRTVQGLTYEELVSRLSNQVGITNQTDLANFLGLGKAAVSWSKKRGTVPLSWITRLEGKGISRTWLLKGEGEMRPPNGLPASDTFNVPVMDVRLDPNGDFTPTPSSHAILCSRSWAESRGEPSRFIALRISGDDAAPDLKDGDIAIIDTDKKTLEPGRFYAFKMFGYLVIRQVSFSPVGIRLMSSYGTRGEIVVEDAASLDVAGKVIWGSREFP